MAVTKLWPVKTNLGQVIEYAENEKKTDKRYFEGKYESPQEKYSASDYQSLQDVLAYAENEEKTEQMLFCQGINCNPATARDQFVAVKEQYGKTDGIQAYHGYLSFKEQNITPELAQQIGMEFAQAVWGDRFQVIVTTHLNTKHLHCHFVFNSVSFVDGKRAHDETSWFKFAPVADRVCEKYGLHIVKKKERNLSPKTLERKDKAGALTPWNITRAAIDDAISRSRSFAEMENALRQMGYTFDFNPNHKYWTIVPMGSKKSVRLYRLGEQYTPDAINRRLAENLRRSRGMIRVPQRQPKQYRHVNGHVEKIVKQKKKSGGLQRLYLHYLYMLGKLPARRKPDPVKVHYALRADLLKLEDISSQARLLCDHNISTVEDLAAYRQGATDRIQTLVTRRSELRNAGRRISISEQEAAQIRQQIGNISEELKKLRQEVKCCDAIAERSGVVAENLEQVRTEQKEQARKENEIYEYKRR